MRICFLRLENFRGIKKADIPFPIQCAFLGANNCGKTTIAHALAILFGRDRWYQNISEHDFYGSNPTPDMRFNIIATLTGFQSANNDPSEFPEWFNIERGARVSWWHETEHIVTYETEQPKNSELAIEIAASGRYDDEICEFELRKYFYDGDTNPFEFDTYVPFPNKLLSKVGFFLIPSFRQSDWLLSFGSSQFLKLLNEINGMPGEEINAFRDKMRDPDIKVENAHPLKELLEELEMELQGFSLLPNSSKVVYRTTQLSVHSVLESLIPHVKNKEDNLLPFSRQGDGFSSVQLLLLLLQFAKKRKEISENTMFLVEEPELHLHPSLQRRLINRLRAYSSQTIVTTHSPLVASMFKPSEVIYLTNQDGVVTPEIVYSGNIQNSNLPNQVRQLYQRERNNFYEALIGQYILIPEGKWDWQWLNLWLRIAEATVLEEYTLTNIKPDWSLSAIEVVHTDGSVVTEFVKEFRRFRNDVFALVDGDKEGKTKVAAISRMDERTKPKAVIQFGTEGEIEDLAAWILEPALANPGPILSAVLDKISKPWTVQVLGLQLKLCEKNGERHKENWELHENLAWEAYGYSNCRDRTIAFLSDIARICSGIDPQIIGWQKSILPNNNVPLFIASFIKNSLS